MFGVRIRISIEKKTGKADCRSEGDRLVVPFIEEAIEAVSKEYGGFNGLGYNYPQNLNHEVIGGVSVASTETLGDMEVAYQKLEEAAKKVADQYEKAHGLCVFVQGPYKKREYGNCGDPIEMELRMKFT